MSKAPVILLASVIGCLSAVHAGYVPDACMNCICYVQSGCHMPDPICHMDGGSLSCGPFQIQQRYWEDARRKGGPLMNDWQICSASWTCSRDAVNGYMERYAVQSRLGHGPTCEDFSRIHNGGPNGFKNPATLAYWGRVKKCLGGGPELNEIGLEQNAQTKNHTKLG
ncbi:lysozyme-like isoform X2 [Branchiostoma floridae]|uniref:lysozyme n=1 Tax=Branchiostoma floridae TaxID=7739 RepID=A0A9J7MTH8_BRAFL|nr:lysozyme-like isoform X2 [Branchiostoma floridae]